MYVKYDWFGQPIKDFTVSVYSKMDLEIRNEEGETNMWHMDGNYPSGFLKSNYLKDTDRFKPDFVPYSLQEAWVAARNFREFIVLIWDNPSILL